MPFRLKVDMETAEFFLNVLSYLDQKGKKQRKVLGEEGDIDPRRPALRWVGGFPATKLISAYSCPPLPIVEPCMLPQGLTSVGPVPVHDRGATGSHDVRLPGRQVSPG